MHVASYRVHRMRRLPNDEHVLSLISAMEELAHHLKRKPCLAIGQGRN